jgi:benzodiazapine receptor
MTQNTFSTSSTVPPVRQVMNITALGAVLTINALANILPINGVTTGEVSDSIPSLFTPAGYVFSIWGLIYALLIVFVIYQALPAQRDNPRLNRLGYGFVVSCGFNFSWILAWHYGVFWLSEILIVGLLVSLIVSYLRLSVNRERVPRAEAIAVQLPFSIYLGWLTVATVANTAITLLRYDITGGWLAPLWTIVAILAAVGIGYLMLRNRKDLAFNLVLVWALVGIAVAQWGSELSVVIAATVAALIVASLIVQKISARGRFAN